MISFRLGCRSAICLNSGRKRQAIVAIGVPARSAAGHSQSIVPSLCQFSCSGRVSDQRRPSMPGRCFQVSMRLRSSGLSSGNQPRMQNLSGYFLAASTAISLEPGVPARRMQHRAVHAGRVHLLDQLLGRVDRGLPMMAARRAAAPDMHLCVDDLHGSSPSRRAMLDAAGRTRQTGRERWSGAGACWTGYC